MNTAVFILVLLSALVHAVLNFFIKKVSGNFTLYWYGLALINIFIFAYSLCTFDVGTLTKNNIIILVLSAVVNAVYFIVVSYSYVLEDISVVYPIARGTGVVGAALFSFFLLRETISPLTLLGIIITVAGILLIGFGKTNISHNIKPYLLAVCTGVLILAYTIIDKIAVRSIDPVFYSSTITLLAIIPLSGIAHKTGFKNTVSMVKKHFKEVVIIGIGAAGGFLLILYAMRSEQASYIIPVREVSVVFAALLGFIFLKEKATPLKLSGIICITAGLILVKAG
jgi:drug/metabolite transporter (DMT)-like permease